MDALLDRLHEQRWFSGAVAIERDGELVYARGVGLANAETRVAFTSKTPTDGASLAKPFTAAALLWLAHEPRVDLDAPVVRYVPEYPHAQTTVRHLLAHSGALPDYDAFDALFRGGEPVTTLAMLHELAKRRTPPAFRPGSRFAYCNVCYDAAALLIERVQDTRFEQVLGERFFEPSKISGAFIRPARLAEMPADRANGYRVRDNRAELHDAEDLEGFYGGANVYASAEDFARFGSAFATGDAIPKAVHALTVASVQLGDGTTTGLTLGSWYCADAGKRCYYAGHHRGFYNVLYWDSVRRLAVAYVSNLTIPQWLRPQLARTLIAAAQGEPIHAIREPALQSWSREALGRSAGRYRVEGVGTVTLRVRDGRAWVQPDRGPEYRLYQASTTLLYAPGLDALVGIGTDGALTWSTVFVEARGRRSSNPRRPNG